LLFCPGHFLTFFSPALLCAIFLDNALVRAPLIWRLHSLQGSPFSPVSPPTFRIFWNHPRQRKKFPVELFSRSLAVPPTSPSGFTCFEFVTTAFLRFFFLFLPVFGPLTQAHLLLPRSPETFLSKPDLLHDRVPSVQICV